MTNNSRIPQKGGLLSAAAEGAEAPASSKQMSSLERARIRAAELKGHVNGLEDATDSFFVPPEIIPDGWTYEWKRKSTFNKEDPAYAVQLARDGWEPVPLNRCKKHKAMMPTNWDGSTIEHQGMILMERPEEITQAYRDIELRKARAQVRQKEAQLSASPEGTFTRDDPRVSPKIRKSYSPVMVPDE